MNIQRNFVDVPKANGSRSLLTYVRHSLDIVLCSLPKLGKFQQPSLAAVYIRQSLATNNVMITKQEDTPSASVGVNITLKTLKALQYNYYWKELIDCCYI